MRFVPRNLSASKGKRALISTSLLLPITAHNGYVIAMPTRTRVARQTLLRKRFLRVRSDNCRWSTSQSKLSSNRKKKTATTRKQRQPPVMKQWAQLKARFPAHVILFRMGDFYEMFADDAIRASELLNIQLGSRHGHPVRFIISPILYCPRLSEKSLWVLYLHKHSHQSIIFMGRWPGFHITQLMRIFPVWCALDSELLCANRFRRVLRVARQRETHHHGVSSNGISHDSLVRGHSWRAMNGRLISSKQK